MGPDSKRQDERIAVIGLGYVGLPVAVAFAGAFSSVTGYDVSRQRVAALKQGEDATGEISKERLSVSSLVLSDDPQSLAGTTFFAVTVPTPVDADKRPDFEPLRQACALIAPHLTTGAVVVFESTVYPGATEEICGPLLAEAANLPREAFHLAYSPERINPGDAAHGLESIIKVVAGEDVPTLERVANVYEEIITAGVHRAPSIMVAEAAKVIENTQRDINIALMNELAVIFDKLDIRTSDVLAAAGTKWNFLPFTPGLVGGHCIGVDPYYLTFKAESVGHHPQVILAGRRINDDMGRFIGQKLVKLLIGVGLMNASAKVGVLGLTFKEDVPDLRNSKVADVIAELREFGINPMVHDPHAAPEDALAHYDIALSPLEDMHDLDAVIVAVGHSQYRENLDALIGKIRPGGVLIDVKSIVDPSQVPAAIIYWSL
jgi:UDP-N-acetyl-D-galactosamine dehydrogenase